MIRTVTLFVTVAVSVGLLMACQQDGPDDELKQEVVANYADGVHHLYSKSLASAKSLDGAIDRFIAEPLADIRRLRDDQR